MRLLDVQNGMQITEFMGTHVPPYAILSHTWEDEEVTFQQMTDPKSALRTGYAKIQQTCALAARDGFAFAWVDTCCIDKSSSAELSEAINSMFYWYQQAEVCYVYLADLAPGADLQSALGACRWFTRGWTLQELIAPRNVLFYDSEWQLRGTKTELSGLISAITGIPDSLLRHGTALSDYAIARRMSWVAHRQTTRVEDIAYCLLGIFDVHMSPRYGERMKAFSRLQQAILRQPTADLSLFAWTNDGDPKTPDIAGILATSPRQFQACTAMEADPGDSVYRNFTATTRGIQVEASIHQTRGSDHTRRTILFLQTRLNDQLMGVSLRRVSGNVYARFHSSMLVPLVHPRENYYYLPVQSVLLATELPGRYPFHATDPVLGNRHSALQVRPPMLQDTRLAGLKLGAQRPYLLFPAGHWDSHDEAFFGTNTVSWGWCGFFFCATITLPVVEGGKGPEGKPKINRVWQEEFFGACFGWNAGNEPRMVLAPLRAVDPATVVVLETSLGQLRYESARQAEAVVRRILKGFLGEGATTVDMPLGGETETEKVTFSLTLGTEPNPKICVNPVSILTIGVSMGEASGSKTVTQAP